MNSIYKYTLKLVEEQVLYLPMGSKILSVQAQHGELQLWALVDTHQPLQENCHICIYGTGQPMPNSNIGSFQFLGTCQLESGSLVLHVFKK